ncbi:MAG: hypothetical protein CL471_07775 [Acidobacteria bacterium]|nr:hypothetical protein [Acidobacteriota bacterium]
MRRFRSPQSLVLCTLVVLAGTGRSLPAQQSLTILSDTGRQSLAVARVNDRPMVALNDLAAAFDLSVREDTLADGLTVTYRDRVVVLTATQGLASVGGRVVSLPSPPVRTSRGWHVPVEFLSRVLGLMIDTPIELRQRSGLVIVGDLRVPEIDVQYTIGRGQAQVVLAMTPQAPHTIEEGPQRLLVKFDADALDVALPDRGPDSLVAAIRLGDEPAWLAIDLGSQYVSHQSTLLAGVGGTARLLVDLFSDAAPAAVARVNERANTAERPPPSVSNLEAAPRDEAAPPLPELTAPITVRTVVIDAGHGGDDTGVAGTTGVLEKDVTLEVAQRLRRAIESRLGLRVVMTRDEDRTIRLDERAAIANNNKADLFISLHANASLSPVPSGAEVSYLSLDEFDVERSGARLSGANPQTVPVLGGGARSIDVVSWEMAQVSHVDRSGVLAAIVDAELRRRVDVRPGEAQRAPFRVLVGANMPAVLVELGFLSNPEEERRLGAPSYQEALSQALYQSIARYRTLVEQRPDSAPEAEERPRGQR